MPQVVDGRMIIEGVDLMRAIDNLPGRLLWETKLPGVGYFYNNLAHQPGANASGSNFVSTPDGIYVAYKQHVRAPRSRDRQEGGRVRVAEIQGLEGIAALGLRERRRRLSDRRGRSALESEIAAAQAEARREFRGQGPRR